MNHITNDASAPKKRGWAGDEMEMDHRREELQAAMSCRSRSSHSSSNRGTRTGTSHSDRNSDNNPSRQQQQLEKYPTVDLEQFYNTRVGSGYQAKGVIRQKTAHDSKIQIIDRSQRAKDGESHVARSVINEKVSDGKMRLGDEEDNDSDSKSRGHSRGKKRKKRHSKRTRSESSPPKQRSNKRLAEKYLQCKGIRDFRKELEKILSESSPV